MPRHDPRRRSRFSAAAADPQPPEGEAPVSGDDAEAPATQQFSAAAAPVPGSVQVISTATRRAALNQEAILRHNEAELPRQRDTERLQSLHDAWIILQMYKVGALKFDLQADSHKGISSKQREDSFQHFDAICKGVIALTAGADIRELVVVPEGEDYAAVLRLPEADSEYRKAVQDVLAIVRANISADGSKRTTAITDDLEGLMKEILQSGSIEKADQTVSQMHDRRKPPPPKPYVPRPSSD